MTPRFRIRPDLADIPAYTPGRSAPGAIKLASNEVVEGPLPSVVDAITGAAAGGNRYPDNGAVALRSALARRFDTDVAHVAVGAGSVSLCQQLVQATCADGDEVVFAWRSFEAYPIIARVAGATPVPVPLTADHRHDLDAMAAAVTDRTRVVFVCNPNNPTGTVVSEAEFEEFLAKVPADVVIALDEAYFEYNRQPGLPDGSRLFRRHPNVAVLRTFSKAYGLAGIRAGYMLADPELVTAVNKVLIPFSVSSLAQVAAITSLRADDELLARTDGVVKERDRVRNALLDAGHEVPASDANFLWIPAGDAAAALAEKCAEAGVLVRTFPGAGIRVTVTTPDENDAFLAAFL